MLFVTGGAGFIGSNFIQEWIKIKKTPVVNLDNLTYSNYPYNLESVKDDPLYTFVRCNIGDQHLVRDLLLRYQPQAVIHFAAESHVDRSIQDPSRFIETNILGSYRFLEKLYEYWMALDHDKKQEFRFMNVSTDEVFGTLDSNALPSIEQSPYAPNSPYSASKASFDHIVRAYHRTYEFPAIISYCSNNFGPFQYPEKLIPLTISRAREGEFLPIYGDGKQIREWIYVLDQCDALRTLLLQGRVGETYNTGAMVSICNIDLVKKICQMLDQLLPSSEHKHHEKLIRFVKDRPGHDRRYAVNNFKFEEETGWRCKNDFDKALFNTIEWYLKNSEWLDSIRSGSFKTWVSQQYGSTCV